MADPQNRFQEPKDSSPLELEQLSDDELATILYVERRLYEAQKSATGKEPPNDAKHHLAAIQVRHPRVLLLDGGRGTGKTSILLTLVHRWTSEAKLDVARHDSDAGAYKKRIEQVQKNPKLKFIRGTHDLEIPAHVNVVGRILDFDPLPPGVPVIAWIVEAWRELARIYDELSAYPENEGEMLLDLWHRLFHVAAVGWSTVSTKSGLIEQVLDREEQVRDWQHLDKRWQSFVDQVIIRGKRLNRFESEPVFVIMIDDCDLQVGRIRELLPALRLLYHPRVFFFIAAHRPHMIDMLKLDFLGQQNKLANCQLREKALSASDSDRWASDLAKSSFEKVFPISNRWLLHQLSLRELLDFPHDGRPNFGTIFESWKQQARTDTPLFGNLASYLRTIAGTEEEPADLPLQWTYRTVHQISERLNGGGAKTEDDVLDEATSKVEFVAGAGRDGSNRNRAAEAIGRIIGGGDYEDRVKITGWCEDESNATKSFDKTNRLGEHQPSIEYLVAGKLSTFPPEEFTEDISGDAEIVLSAQPGFRYNSPGFPDISPAENILSPTSAIIAKSLQDDRYGVVAPRLRWEVRLALAWTRVRLSTELAFRWGLHQHPSPLRLLYWAKDWRGFVVDLSQQTSNRLERIAYAWIYHQLRWMSKDGLTRDLNPVPLPMSKKFNESGSWEKLLAKEPEIGTAEERGDWKYLTLPLLARPELGLSPDVQKRLLKPVEGNKEIMTRLRNERRRLITDAILTAAEEKGILAKNAEAESRVDDLIKEIEARHQRIYKGHHSRWWEIMERRPRPGLTIGGNNSPGARPGKP